MTGDEAGGVGGQEDGGAGEFVELAETAHGGAQQELAAALGTVQERGVQIGAQDAGDERVDADAGSGPLDGEGLGERSDGGFAGAVGSNFVEAEERGERADIDDAAVTPLEHVTAEDAASAQRAVEVGVDDGVPLGFGKIEGGHAPGAAGAIDENLDAAEFSRGGREELLETLDVGDVAGLREGAAAERLDFRGGFAHQVGAAAGGHYVGTGQRETLGQREADAAGAADDDGGFVCEIELRMSHKDFCWRLWNDTAHEHPSNK